MKRTKQFERNQAQATVTLAKQLKGFKKSKDYAKQDRLAILSDLI